MLPSTLPPAALTRVAWCRLQLLAEGVVGGEEDTRLSPPAFTMAPPVDFASM